MENFGQLFGFHTLTLEDIANTQQRPKIEDMDEYLFLVLKMFSFDEVESKIKEEQISLVLGKNYVVTFQENESSDDFVSVKERITKAK